VPVDPIRHVIVLMFENHSFDQMLGSLRAEIPALEGVDFDRGGVNLDPEGREYRQRIADPFTVAPDPMHETVDVLEQLEDDNGGFVRDYATSYPSTTEAQHQQVMDCFGPGALPALHELAREFTICDRWFSSVPGPTWTNRLFVHSGTSLGRVRMPESLPDSLEHPGLYVDYDQTTIYDRFNEAGISWRIYRGDIPQSLVLAHQRSPENVRRYFRFSEFAGHATSEADFPAYCFIEPSYYWPDQNDDHPPHATWPAQRLLADVYNAVRANEVLWNSTLLVVLYDEHGGFYDHVSPPAAIPPDDFVDPESGFGFDRLGVRVPAVLVSPWVDRGVVHTEFDHTSLLKYLIDKWGLGPLSRRVDQASSLAPILRTSGEPRTDTPVSLLVEERKPVALAAEAAASADEPLNPHQEALILFADYLERTEIAEPAGKPAREALAAAGPQSRAEAAKQRIDQFIAEKKAESAAAPPAPGEPVDGTSPSP
jgi:phospholipase C